MKNAEVNFHGTNLASIKDLSSDLNIADKKWDLLFDFMVRETNYVYFEGNRSNDFDGLLKEHINENAKEISARDMNFFSVIIETYQNRLMWSRASMNKLWLYYEYPAFIFLKERIPLNELEKAIKLNVSYSNLTNALSGIYVCYRNFEQDVLWLYKSSDMTFPEFG